MSTLDYFDHPEKKQEKEHFNHMIEVAIADGVIHANEMEMLRRMGRRIGLTEPEFESLISTAKKSAYHPPYELSKRFSQMYDIVSMILADGKVTNAEYNITYSLALKSGFTEHEIPDLVLLLIKGIKCGEDEEEIFKAYRKRKLVS